MKNSSTLRLHANLIRKNALLREDQETDQALAYADQLTARADLQDALAGIPNTSPATADDAADEIQNIPLIGKLTLRGGVKHRIEFPWTEAHAALAHSLGIMVSFQWCYSLHSPDAGKCQYIYIGTREAGPLAQWTASSNSWHPLKSKGNYGKNWASGGNWHNATLFAKEPPAHSRPCGFSRHAYVFDTLEHCNPILHQQIQDIMNTTETQQDRIRIAKAKIKAAEMRILAASNRQRVGAYNRQGSTPAYDGQGEVCYHKAAQAEQYAAKQEAMADLILAEAGA